MTQCEKIIAYMEAYGSISTMEAFTDLGVTRLASRIHDLRREGHSIKGVVIHDRNRFGEPVHYVRYSLEG